MALKLILTGIPAGLKDSARFRAAAAAMARLQHPSIVQVYDVGTAAGRPYFVLEFVAGGTLAQHLEGRPQPVRPAAELVETLARAVHAAHTGGVIHGNLTPANILLQTSPVRAPRAGERSCLTPKIADFGLARCAGSAAAEFRGTPSSMAPEQAMDSRRHVGPAADVHALGAILHELLTGRPPFTGETPRATILHVLHDEPVAVTSLQPSVPRVLETICQRCLRKEPGERYGSALELAEDLQRFLRDEPIRARPVLPMERLWRWVRRHPRPLPADAAPEPAGGDRTRGTLDRPPPRQG